MGPDEQAAYIQQQLAALQADNARLTAELEQIRQREEALAQARAQVIRGGARILIPLLDRHGVVRSFSQMVTKATAFVGPREQWPTRNETLDAARAFGETCVRFVVRRRLFVLLFSLLASSIPIIQVYLVVQQNEIIENQNDFFRIQVYDVVARSMTEGDRNAKLMTGALLANADPTFLADVVEESFDPELAGVWSSEGAGAQKRRLEDAAFRGYLAHAVVRSVRRRVDAGDDVDDLPPRTTAMVARVIADAADRVPAVMQLGSQGPRSGDELDEQVDNYLEQVGAVLRLYGRFARSTGDTADFEGDVRTLLQRVASLPVAGNRYEPAYRVAMEAFLIDTGTGAKLTDPPLQPPSDDGERAAARAKGIEVLSDALGSDAIDWDVVAQQGAVR